MRPKPRQKHSDVIKKVMSNNRHKLELHSVERLPPPRTNSPL